MADKKLTEAQKAVLTRCVELEPYGATAKSWDFHRNTILALVRRGWLVNNIGTLRITDAGRAALGLPADAAPQADGLAGDAGGVAHVISALNTANVCPISVVATGFEDVWELRDDALPEIVAKRLEDAGFDVLSAEDSDDSVAVAVVRFRLPEPQAAQTGSDTLAGESGDDLTRLMDAMLFADLNGMMHVFTTCKVALAREYGDLTAADEAYQAHRQQALASAAVLHQPVDVDAGALGQLDSETLAGAVGSEGAGGPVGIPPAPVIPHTWELPDSEFEDEDAADDEADEDGGLTDFEVWKRENPRGMLRGW